MPQVPQRLPTPFGSPPPPPLGTPRSRSLPGTTIICRTICGSDPRNLSKITPPELDFTVLTALPERIYAGMMIEYRVRPLLGIPARWLTEITHVEPGKFFVDEQRIGPYKIWHHEHHFRPLAKDQTEIHDRVTYVLPMGPIGNLIHPFLVKPQLSKIFAFREKRVRELFG